MKVSLEWLRAYVDFSGSANELAELLTGIGLNIDAVEPIGDDWMLDVEVTSNRPDCLGHIGIAREVAAVTGAALKIPPTDFTEQGKAVEQWTAVAIESPDLCRRYTARIIDGIQMGPSPDWMRRRLEAIGVRSISNVVDITNYVLMEIGQPLHAFDWAKLNEGRIVVRRACPGEQLVSIDESKLELNESNLVIADAAEPVALAGVMGGLASEVRDDTQTVLLESAHFDPLNVRTTSRSLAIGSESSFRFERNVDIEMLGWASRRAATLLAELAGGRVVPGMIDVRPVELKKLALTMRLSRLQLLTGIPIDTDTVLNILFRLGFAPKLDGDMVRCTTPSWRSDVYRETDLIEEVIRIYGYSHIPTENKIHITVSTEDARQRGRKKIVAALNGCGYFETVNIGFIEDRHWRGFVDDGFEPIRVKDVTRKSANALRPSVLPSLLEVRKRNQDAGNEPCHFYELAAVHRPSNQPDMLPEETIALGLLTDHDFRSLRGVVEAVVNMLDRHATLTCQPCSLAWCQPGTGAELRLNGKSIGVAGQVCREIIKNFDLLNPVCMAELNFMALIESQSTAAQLQPLIRFPGVTRDLSLVLDEVVCWADIESAIGEQPIDDLRRVEFVGIYRGKGIEPGKKSLTLSMHFRNAEQTLTHEQVDSYQSQVLTVLQTRFNATLRE